MSWWFVKILTVSLCCYASLQLNQALLRVQAVQLPVLVYAWRARHGKDLSYLLEKEAGGWYETALLALVKGPLAYDVELVNRACSGVGTNEQLLNELVIGRTPYGLDMLKGAYRQTYHKDFDQSESSLGGFVVIIEANLGTVLTPPSSSCHCSCPRRALALDQDGLRRRPPR